MISGVVLARNEEANIVGCLEALRPYVSEILLIDMESTDRTVELARPYVTKVLYHPLVANFDGARNLAIPAAAYDWFWFVDADERIGAKTGEFVNRLVRLRGHEFDALTIPFKSYCCGQWMRHCGWWPGYCGPRVLKRGTFRYADEIHGGVRFEGRELVLDAIPEFGIDHYGIRSVEHYCDKIHRYSTANAQNLAARGARWNWRAGMRQMMQELWRYYDKNPGWLDGQHGWLAAWMSGQYEWLSQAKLLDLGPSENQIPPQEAAPADLDEVIRCMQDELARFRARDPRPPFGLVWRATLWNESGYAEEARGMVKALARHSRPLVLDDALGCHEQQVEIPPENAALFRALSRAHRPAQAVAVAHGLGDCFAPDPRAAVNVLRTMIETDRLPEHWLPRIEAFDEVWVPTKHVEVACRHSGVPPEKICVVPGCVDADIFRPDGPALDLPDALNSRFVFLSIFDWVPRKGWDILVPAYCEEFSLQDEAALLVKVTRLHGQTLDEIRDRVNQTLAPLNQSLDDRWDIVLWDQTFSTHQMAALYRSSDAFVLASRGEGCGRPYMEAMASGLPTIGSAGSGNVDFMDETNSILIPGDGADVAEWAVREFPLFRGHRWFEPDPTALKRAMRQVFNDAELRQRIGGRAAEHIRSHYDLQAGARAVEHAVRRVEDRFAASTPPPPEPHQVRVVIEGDFFAGHSFSHVNEQLALQLSQSRSLALSIHRRNAGPPGQRSPIAHHILPYQRRDLGEGPPITIRHAYPPDWSPTKGLWIHIQPWEYGHLPLDWVQPLCEMVHEIWAPTEYVRRVYERSGVPSEKIHVIPWGVDPDVFTPDVPPLLLPTPKTFRFLYVGGTIARKGFDRLWEAYLAEFSRDEDVCLVIKDMGADSFYAGNNCRQQILAACKDLERPAIVYFDRHLTAGQMAGLYAACDCLAAPYRGEGFGLPILEAMACGLPAIVPQGGASDDFVSEATGYLLPSQEREVPMDLPLCGPALEMSIEQADLRAMLRRAFERFDDVHEKGRAAADHVRCSFRWSDTARRMIDRIQTLAAAGRSGSAGLKSRAISGAQPVHVDQSAICAVVAAENCEANIARCLARLQPRVKRICCLVGNCTDRTGQIVQEYGGVIAEGETGNASCDESLQDADWLLYLRGDEVIEEDDLESLSRMLAAMPDNVMAVALRAVFHDHAGRAVASQSEVRAIRRDWLPGSELLPLSQIEPMLAFDSDSFRATDVVVKALLPDCLARPELRDSPRHTIPEPWLAPWAITAGEVFLDVGANVGQWSRSLAATFDKVYAIEPNPQAIEQLRSDLPENVYVEEVAAWSMDERRSFTTFESSAHLSAYFDQEGINTGPRTGEIVLPCRRLDGLDITGRVTFLKCDAEGAEVHVLAGARDLVSRHRPVILIEVHSQDNLRALTAMLSEWRYDFLIIRHPDYEPFSRLWSEHLWLCCWPYRPKTSADGLAC
jgi:FkbM family methyltransferase